MQTLDGQANPYRPAKPKDNAMIKINLALIAHPVT